MAKVSAFGYTNKTDSSHAVTPKLLGLTSNYATTAETAQEITLSNKTSPIDQEEIMIFRSRPIGEVRTELSIQYPGPLKGGVQYQGQSEAVLTTTDSADPSFRVDEPIVIQTLIRHPRSGNFTNAVVAEAFIRHISQFVKADGTWRFDDLMRGAERPVVD